MTERLVLTEGDITGHLGRGCEARILASTPEGHVGGKRIVIEAVSISYRLEDEPRRVPAPTTSSRHGTADSLEPLEHSLSGARDDHWAV